MAEAKALFFTCVFVAYVQTVLSKEGVSLHLKANHCKQFNPKYVFNVTCRVRAYNRTTQLMFYEVNHHPGVFLSDSRIDITSYRKFGTAYRPSLVKLSEDWCAAMNGSMSHYIRLMLSSFEKYGNIIKPCPVSGKLYVKNMIIDRSNFPPFAPIGDYRMDYYWYTMTNGKREFVLLLQDFWEIRPLGAMEF